MTTRRVHQKSKTRIGQIPPRTELLQEGPCVEVLIGLAESYARQLVRDGQSVPSPVSGRALIDTGASTTGIDGYIGSRPRIACY